MEDDFKASRKAGVLAYHLDRTGEISNEFILKDLKNSKHESKNKNEKVDCEPLKCSVKTRVFGSNEKKEF